MQVFHDIEQGTEEWFQVRAGIPTASMFKEVMAKKGPRGGIPKGRLTYMRKLAGEILTGQPMDSYSNYHMERGHEWETEARDLYAMIRETDIDQVGFIRNRDCGCSPDGLVNQDGLWECKTALPHIQIERLENGGLPAEHVAQGQLMVSEREWLDFMSYCRGLPPLIVRVERDEKFIAGLRFDLEDFCNELNELTEKIRTL